MSIVVPTLNEEQALPSTLAAVRRQVPLPADVVVVDGGSADGTAAVAAAAEVRMILAGLGRGVQLNAGAIACRNTSFGGAGDALLFLHADTELPDGALAAVERALVDPTVMGGCFQLKFITKKRGLFSTLRLMEWCTRFRPLQNTRLVFGDRAIFVRRNAFERLGGYHEWPLLEDIDFVTRLGQTFGARAFRFLPLDVSTSGRRFEASGPLRQVLVNSFITTSWWLGVSPTVLRRLYSYARRARASTT